MIKFLAILIINCPLVFGFANVNVDAQPHVATDGIAHISPEAVKIGTGTVTAHGEKDMVHVEPITGTVWAKAEILPGGLPVTGTVNVAEKAINTEIPVTFTVTPKAINIELHVDAHAFDGAIVVNAQGVTDAALKPMQKIEAVLETASNKATSYLWYVVIGFGLIAFVAIGVLIFHLFHHARVVASLTQKGDSNNDETKVIHRSSSN